MDEMRLRRYAELAVRVGANVQEGQDLGIEAYVEHAPFARALVRAGYEAGARHVEVFYADQHVQLARLQLAPEESLGWVPEWHLERLRSLAERQGFEILRCTYANSLLAPIALAKFRIWEPLVRSKPESGVQPVSAWLNRALYLPLKWESGVLDERGDASLIDVALRHWAFVSSPCRD